MIKLVGSLQEKEIEKQIGFFDTTRKQDGVYGVFLEELSKVLRKKNLPFKVVHIFGGFNADCVVYKVLLDTDRVVSILFEKKSFLELDTSIPPDIEWYPINEYIKGKKRRDQLYLLIAQKKACERIASFEKS